VVRALRTLTRASRPFLGARHRAAVADVEARPFAFAELVLEEGWRLARRQPRDRTSTLRSCLPVLTTGDGGGREPAARDLLARYFALLARAAAYDGDRRAAEQNLLLAASERNEGTGAPVVAEAQALVAIAAGDHGKATAALREAVAVARPLPADRRGQLLYRLGTAMAAETPADPQEAIAVLEEAGRLLKTAAGGADAVGAMTVARKLAGLRSEQAITDLILTGRIDSRALAAASMNLREAHGLYEAAPLKMPAPGTGERLVPVSAS